MDSPKRIITELTMWDSIRIGMCIPCFIYSFFAILVAYSTKDTALLFALEGTAIGTLGFGFGLLSSISTGIQLRELKRLLEKSHN
jgi:hypothetical protein